MGSIGAQFATIKMLDHDDLFLGFAEFQPVSLPLLVFMVVLDDVRNKKISKNYCGENLFMTLA